MTAEPTTTDESSSASTSGEIASLPPVSPAEGLDLNPRTGEPRRPWSIRLAATASWLAVVAAAAVLLTSYWQAVTDFSTATWLGAQFAEASVLTRVLVTVAVTASALVTAIGAVITGYYAWTGYRWTQIAGAITAALSLLTLLISPLAWVVIGLSLAADGLLWLRSSAHFFDLWHARRHAEPAFAAPVVEVAYGPLPRYRSQP